MSTDIEARLRNALAARAARITPEHLRPALPPTMRPARDPTPRLLHRLAWTAALLLLAAITTVTLRPHAPEPQQPPPAVSPSPVVPPPSPAPSPRNPSARSLPPSPVSSP